MTTTTDAARMCVESAHRNSGNVEAMKFYLARAAAYLAHDGRAAECVHTARWFGVRNAVREVTEK